MATLSQIEANRRNAQHSTGPRTVEGKAASSMNALKSGIDAESSIIPGEDAASHRPHRTVLAGLPASNHHREYSLVDNIIRASWRLRRFDRIDAEILIHAIEDTNYPSPNGPAGKAFNNTSSTQSRLQRRINDTSRLPREAIKDLQRRLAERSQPQSPTNPQRPAPQSDETELPASTIGFVPQTPLMQSAPKAPESAPPLPPAPGHPAPESATPRYA
jgi:hypothetical protein